MTELLALLATLAAALFAGAALYISLVEHPARMQLETRVAAAQWAASYRRAPRLLGRGAGYAPLPRGALCDTTLYYRQLGQ